LESLKIGLAKTIEDLKDSTKLTHTTIDTAKILEVLQYSFDTHFVNAYSRKSVAKKINRIITEYEV